MIVVSAVTFILMLCSLIFLPKIKIKNISFSTYWVITLVGSAAIILSGNLSVFEAYQGITENTLINPLKIIVLFLSVTVLSIYLDEIGFFKYIAFLTVNRAKASQKKLFVYFYAVIAILTVFTSNDIIILTFTPFICYFAKETKINPFPYLIAEFICANTWSMALIIGNPTNIYLATSYGIGFFEYFKIMILPTVMGGVVSFFLLFLLFKKNLDKPLENKYFSVEKPNKGLLFIGLFHLGVCTLLFIISSYVLLEMWFIALICAGSLFTVSLIYRAVTKEKPIAEFSTIKRAPYEIIPFVLSMFIFVLAFNKAGITDFLGRYLYAGKFTILSVGTASVLFCNVINNIPMSVLFSSALKTVVYSDGLGSVYACIVGSNIGAYLTPIGALAGIMWSNILKKQGIKLSFLSFVKYGIIIAVPTLLVTLGGIYIVLG